MIAGKTCGCCKICHCEASEGSRGNLGSRRGIWREEPPSDEGGGFFAEGKKDGGREFLIRDNNPPGFASQNHPPLHREG